MLDYKNVIIPSKQDEYKDVHKILYRTLSSMIFDLSFLESALALQNHEIMSDVITVKFLHRDLFQILIMKTYRAFFDNSGDESTNILKFKNKVVGEYIDPQYKDEVLGKIRQLPIEDRIYRVKRDKIQENIIELRDHYIAHGLYKPEKVAEVSLPDIRELLEYGCQLFQELSFNPSSFYTFMEGDGYDFSKEFSYTKQSTELFLKYGMLSSSYIKKISVEIDGELVTPEIKDTLEHVVNDINSKKEKTI